MAMSLRYTCESCGFTVEGWDDGNPYVGYENGDRDYYYHPISESEVFEMIMKKGLNELRRGNALDHICMNCESITMLDPYHDKMVCRKCKGTELIETYEMGGKSCPKCEGKMDMGKMGAIS